MNGKNVTSWNTMQYQVCAQICNDVVIGSIDEEKFRVYRSGVLHILPNPVLFDNTSMGQLLTFLL